RGLAEQAGLQIETERYWFQWTCPAKLIIRMLEGALHLKPELPAIPARPVNRAFYMLSRLEHKTLGKMPFPFGTSLMVLARKSASPPAQQPAQANLSGISAVDVERKP